MAFGARVGPRFWKVVNGVRQDGLFANEDLDPNSYIAEMKHQETCSEEHLAEKLNNIQTYPHGNNNTYVKVLHKTPSIYYDDAFYDRAAIDSNNKLAVIPNWYKMNGADAENKANVRIFLSNSGLVRWNSIGPIKEGEQLFWKYEWDKERNVPGADFKPPPVAYKKKKTSPEEFTSMPLESAFFSAPARSSHDTDWDFEADHKEHLKAIKLAERFSKNTYDDNPALKRELEKVIPLKRREIDNDSNGWMEPDTVGSLLLANNLRMVGNQTAYHIGLASSKNAMAADEKKRMPAPQKPTMTGVEKDKSEREVAAPKLETLDEFYMSKEYAKKARLADPTKKISRLGVPYYYPEFFAEEAQIQEKMQERNAKKAEILKEKMKKVAKIDSPAPSTGRSEEESREKRDLITTLIQKIKLRSNETAAPASPFGDRASYNRERNLDFQSDFFENSSKKPKYPFPETPVPRSQQREMVDEEKASNERMDEERRQYEELQKEFRMKKALKSNAETLEFYDSGNDFEDPLSFTKKIANKKRPTSSAQASSALHPASMRPVPAQLMITPIPDSVRNPIKIPFSSIIPSREENLVMDSMSFLEPSPSLEMTPSVPSVAAAAVPTLSRNLTVQAFAAIYPGFSAKKVKRSLSLKLRQPPVPAPAPVLKAHDSDSDSDPDAVTIIAVTTISSDSDSEKSSDSS
jgi:hypothetical protein